MEALARDLRHAARLLRRSPGFTLLAALTIALGVGPTTTVFSVANGLLVRTPPGVRRTEGLLSAYARQERGFQYATISYPDFQALRDGTAGAGTLVAVAQFSAGLAAQGAGEPERVSGMMVSAEYFAILGTRAAAGRLFLDEDDDVPNGNPVVVLSHRLWDRRFGANPSVIGRSVTLNRGSYTIIGVAEEAFQGHVSAVDVALWVPITMRQALTGIDLSRNTTGLMALGRLAGGTSLGQARAAMEAAWQRIRAEHPDLQGDAGGARVSEMGAGQVDLVVSPYSVMIDEGRGPVTVFLAMLLVVTGVVLLIASVNVAGVFLARSAARAREIGIRLAIGAGAARVVRLLVAESVLVFLLGGAAGVALAFWATHLLAVVRLPTPVQMSFDFTPDARVLAIALAVVLASGLLAGLTPALQAVRQDITSVLKGTGGSTPRGARMRSAFVVAQVAGSVVLLIGGAVFLRALGRADSVDLGFDPRNVHVMTVDLSLQQYTDAEAATFFEDLRRRGAALPGVTSAAVATALPMGFVQTFSAFRVPGVERYRPAGMGAVSPGYFETMRIDVLAGRGFAEGDGPGAQQVVVINQEAARTFWPGQEAVGRQLEGRGGTAHTVVGVVRDGTYASVGSAVGPMVYIPFLQMPFKHAASLVVRTAPGAPRIDRPVRQIALDLDPGLPVESNLPYEQLIGVSLLPHRVAAAIAGTMGLLGLALAAVGLFGLLSYVVSLRGREMGIRMALGASAGAVRLLVVRQGMRLVVLGLLIGGPLALGAGFLARGLLYGLSPADPLTFGAVAGLLFAVGISASVVPALRATAPDPASVLRAE